MGIYDRDYYRDDDSNRWNRNRKRRSGGILPPGLSGVALVIILNVALFLINQASGNALFNKMALFGRLADQPLEWYRCLTYGFAHDPSGLMHILCNMFVLFFFGPPIEQKYGRREFLAFYLASVVFGGVVWNILHFGEQAAALGASGAISAVVILFAMNYPRAQVLIFGIVPTPAWLAGVGYVLYDAFGAHTGAGNVAHDVHLSGAAFAFLYYWLNLRISEGSIGRGRNKKSLKSLFGGGNGASKYSSKADKNGKTGNFSVFNGDFDADSKSSNASVEAPSRWFNKKTAKETAEEIAFEELEAEVDRLLFKISDKGEESLTEAERETLRRASREYQKRQQNN